MSTIKDTEMTPPTVDYGAPTPETEEFMLRINDTEIDLAQVEAQLQSLECERDHYQKRLVAAVRENERLGIVATASDTSSEDFELRQQLASALQSKAEDNERERILALFVRQVAEELKIPVVDLPRIVRTVKFLVDNLTAGAQTILSALASENAGDNPKQEAKELAKTLVKAVLDDLGGRSGFDILAECRNMVRRDLETLVAGKLVGRCINHFAETTWRKQSEEYVEKLAKVLGATRGEDTPLKLAEEAVADRIRLDWLEKMSTDENGDVVKLATFSNGEVHVVLGKKLLGCGSNLRVAIDAARRK